jgi:hypothetical protein
MNDMAHNWHAESARLRHSRLASKQPPIEGA